MLKNRRYRQWEETKVILLTYAKAILAERLPTLA